MMSNPGHFPSKNNRILYHDPITSEACAAIVVKVHPDGSVNLVFFTEEGAFNNKMNVPWGPGIMGSYWFRSENGPKGDWAE
jgi:hypothetical protein